MTGAVDSIDRSSRAAATVGTGEERLQAEDDGRRLTLVLRRGKIVSARHEGAADPAEARVFDAFCQVLEGLPIQEAADHAGHHAMARLKQPDGAPPVPGIVTPWNADPLYHRPMRLIRRIRADHAARQPAASVENFWNPAISKDWLRLDEADQLARVDRILDDFLAERGLAPGSLVAVGVEHNIRVLLAFSEAVGYQRKPALLMAFERELRARTGDRLEVFAEEMADGNRIRRL
ncbi:MAG TPA: hypothetical protein VGA50_01350 [Kiloniellales bacterium]